MKQNCCLKIADQPIVIKTAIDFVSDVENGATTSFIGTIRQHNLGREVTGVSYDVHEELTRCQFNKICQQASERWGDGLKIYVVHYKGRLQVSGTSVVIAVGTPHRKETFEVCRYMIEMIKQEFPIWKKEYYVDGHSEWVKGHALCAQQ